MHQGVVKLRRPPVGHLPASVRRFAKGSRFTEVTAPSTPGLRPQWTSFEGLTPPRKLSTMTVPTGIRREVSSGARAPALHAGGRGFKSPTSHHPPLITTACGVVVQLVRTPACHAGGREFESRRPRHFALLKPPIRAAFVSLRGGADETRRRGASGWTYAALPPLRPGTQPPKILTTA